MAYRTYFRSVLNDNFKILTWVLILFIAITPNFIFMRSANAANVGGWNLSNAAAQGASTVYDATKNVVINGKDFIKNSSVKITPTASQVAKTIARTAGVMIAIEMLIGAVDWVLDPANNRVIYYEEPPAKDKLPKLWVWDAQMDGKDGVPTAEQACKNSVQTRQQAQASGNYMYEVFKSVSYASQDTATCYFDAYNTVTNEKYEGTTSTTVTRKVNSAYNPNAADEREEKYLPYDVVAQQLISNASGGQPEAQAHTMAAAATAVAEAETDNTKARPIVSQAEANATTKPADAAEAEKANEATGTSQPNTANPEATDIALEFPVFCNWAPTICEAAQTVISFPQMLTNWWDTANQKANEWATAISEAWTYAKNWATENYTDSESTKVTVEQDNTIIFDDSQRITFGNSCPTPQQFSVSFSGTTQNLEFSYEPLCQFMSMIKPFVVAGSYLIGAYIVMGLSRGSAE